jgi:hypothetical protein
LRFASSWAIFGSSLREEVRRVNGQGRENEALFQQYAFMRLPWLDASGLPVKLE